MTLRAMFNELLGEEVQQHPVTLGGKTMLCYFRQITDGEARDIFKPVPGEDNEARTLRLMRGLVAASVCDADGKPVSTPDEAAALPLRLRQELFVIAGRVNGIIPPADAEQPEPEEPTADDNGEGAARPNG